MLGSNHSHDKFCAEVLTKLNPIKFVKMPYLCFLQEHISQATEDLNLTDEGNAVESDEVDSTAQSTKKSRPTPESIAMDRGIQNVTRKVHKNNKSGDRKLGMLLLSLTILYTVISI